MMGFIKFDFRNLRIHPEERVATMALEIELVHSFGSSVVHKFQLLVWTIWARGLIEEFDELLGFQSDFRRKVHVAEISSFRYLLEQGNSLFSCGLVDLQNFLLVYSCGLFDCVKLGQMIKFKVITPFACMAYLSSEVHINLLPIYRLPSLVVCGKLQRSAVLLVPQSCFAKQTVIFVNKDGDFLKEG